MKTALPAFLFLALCLTLNPLLSNPDTSDSLENVLKSHSHTDTTRIILLNKLASSLRRTDAGKGLNYANEAIQLSASLDFFPGIASANKIKADIFSDKGELDLSLEHYARAIEFYLKANDLGGEASCHLGIGNIYDIKGKYDLALSSYLKALEMAKKAGSQRGLALSQLGIGNMMMMMKRYKEASAYYSESYEIFKAVNDPMKSWALNNLAAAYENSGSIDRALEMYLESAKIKQEEKDHYGLSFTYDDIGNVYKNKKDYKKSLEYYNLALELKKQISNNDELLAHTLSRMAMVYSQMKEFDTALHYYSEAKINAEKANAKGEQLNILQGLSELFASQHDFEKAYRMHLRFFQLNDSIFNEESSRQIAEMQTKYETEKKENKIRILSQENQIQSLSINRQRTIIYSACAGILMLFAIAFLLFKSYRQKKKTNLELERKNASIVRQNSEIQKQKGEIEAQKHLIEEAHEALREKNKQVTDSILYAKRIQRALLTSEKYLDKNLSEYFVFFKPKDIVSGDFYWALNKEGKILVVTADCTGHGVPGAFMSMIGISFLNEIIIEKNILQPDLILNELRGSIIKTLNPDETENYYRYSSHETEIKDGMDMTLCSYDFGKMEMQVSASNNPAWIVRNKTEFTEIIPDKMPVGKYIGEIKPFTLHNIKLQKGDCIYTFSDGYADQFGGPKGKKFKYRQLQQLLLSISQEPMKEQKNILSSRFELWKGHHEQIDDICILGIRV